MKPLTKLFWKKKNIEMTLVKGKKHKNGKDKQTHDTYWTQLSFYFNFLFFVCFFFWPESPHIFQIQRCTSCQPFSRDEYSSGFWINECVFDTNLGLEWDWTLKHSENQAPGFSTGGGIQLERPLKIPLSLHCNIQFPASPEKLLLIKLGFYYISEEEKILLRLKLC